MEIANELVKQGYAQTIKQARKQYVGPCAKAGTVTKKLTAKESIELINEAGGIACVAHPQNVRHRGIQRRGAE